MFQFRLSWFGLPTMLKLATAMGRTEGGGGRVAADPARQRSVDRLSSVAAADFLGPDARDGCGAEGDAAGVPPPRGWHVRSGAEGRWGVLTMTLQVLDPTNERAPPLGQPARRAASLTDRIVGIISNGKVGTKGFFTHLDRMLRDEFGVADVVLRTKSNFSAPADRDIVDEITRWHAVVTGIGD